MLIPSFFTYFVLGFLLAAVFGQVSVEIFRRSIKSGFWIAAIASAGSVLADFIYFNLVFSGLIFILNKEGILQVLWIIGGFVVSYLAIRNLTRRTFYENVNESTNDTNPFFTGFLITILNPLGILWWSTIAGPMIVMSMRDYSTIHTYFNSLGIVFGLFAWWLLFSFVVSRTRSRLNARTLNIITKTSSFVLFGFALWFFYNAYMLYFIY